MVHLKQLLYNRILHDMIEPVLHAEDDSGVVLVLCGITSRIISSCCRMYNLMDAGILAVESLQLNRQALDMSVLYFIEPTPDNIQYIINDFSLKHKYKYTGRVHCYFTDTISDQCLNQLSDCHALSKRIVTLQELNIQWQANESFVYTLVPTVQPSLLYHINNTIQQRQQHTAQLHTIAKQLVTLCSTLHQLPTVRFYGSSDACRQLGSMVESELQQMKLKLPAWKYNENYSATQQQYNTLIILDRTIDTVAPLLHEFTYQAMCMDLLEVQGEICHINTTAQQKIQPANTAPNDSSTNDNVVVLSEDDQLWCELRHQHIGGVLSSISEKFNEFRKLNRVAGVAKDVKKVSVKELVKAMSDMPQYKQLIQRYQKHMLLTEQLRKLFDTRKLDKIAELEQLMATGLDVNNQPIDHKAVKLQLSKLCMDESVTVQDKLRLCVIYMLTCIPYPTSESVRRDILNIIGDSNANLQAAVLNAYNSVRPYQQDVFAKTTSKQDTDKHRITELIQRNADSQFNLMRYSPMLRSTMEDLISGDASQDTYPTLSFIDESTVQTNAKVDNGSKSSGRSLRRKGEIEEKKESIESSSAEECNKPTTIMFVLNGITYNEVRELYDISERRNCNIVLGSNVILTPKQYLAELANSTREQLEQHLVAAGDEAVPTHK